MGEHVECVLAHVVVIDAGLNIFAAAKDKNVCLEGKPRATRRIGAARGAILDRNGYPLATTVDAFDVFVNRADWQKLDDARKAAATIAPLIGPDTAIVSFQNGVQKDDILRRMFGDKAVMGGVGYIATRIGRPGVIKHSGVMQRLVFGEYDGRRSARAEALLEACQRGGINAELSGDIRREIWEKFVFLVGLSATTTTMRLPIGPIRAHAQTRAFLFEIMREVVAVGRAHGVALAADYAEQRLAFCDGLPADMTSSMYHDLEGGKPLELAWLSGGVVELGEASGVPTPANRAVRDILALHAQGRGNQAHG